MEAFSTLGGGFVTSTQISLRKELSRFITQHSIERCLRPVSQCLQVR